MIENYFKAGYPCLYLITKEPERAETVVTANGATVLQWDCLGGISSNGKTIEPAYDAMDAINWLNRQTETVLMAHNLHLWLEAPEIIQAIQNGARAWKRNGSCLIIVAPNLKLNPELEPLFHVLDLPLPSSSDLLEMQGEFAKSYSIPTDYQAAIAARGLTAFEAETAFSLSLVKKGRFDSSVITEAKAQMIRKSGLMEFWPPVSAEQVGGLEPLKAYITNRARAFDQKNFGLPKPKGILLVGVPGTGKSLSAKATASILSWPLIRLDISALKNSLVGESERRMREACSIIEAFGEAVVWIDELEKSLGGAKTAGETGDTSGSMLGVLLTFMQENKGTSMFMATANDISKLPTELLRRFDAIFFVDMPTQPERLAIIEIMNRKYSADIPLEYAGQQTAGWTGAEIEQLAKDSLFDGLEVAYSAIVPMSKTMREDVDKIREWGSTRARRANSEVTESASTARRLQIQNEEAAS